MKIALSSRLRYELGTPRSNRHREPPMKIFQRIANADAHHRFLAVAVLSAIMFAGLAGRVSMMAHIFITWDFFSFCMLALAWIRIVSADPRNARQTARLQDSSYTAIFVFVIISACASLLALGILLGSSAKDLSGGRLTGHILLSVSTVICSWLLVHTMFAIRYAHLFYKKGCTAHGSGLEIPGEKEPDYIDFAYFSFVIGMTFQVSDIQITSRAIRRLALVHSIVSFAFNMIILALTVNIISGLL
jgi:uncharacterized membrane protein